MTRYILVVLSWLAIFGMPACATADIQKCPDTKTAPSFEPNELLIVFKKGTESSRIHTIHESLKVEVLREYFGGDIALVKIPDGSSIEELCQAYNTFSEVKSVGLNFTTIRPLKS